MNHLYVNQPQWVLVWHHFLRSAVNKIRENQMN